MHEASRRLRSCGAITCVIPWSRTRLGDRSFDVAGPRLWNKLRASLRSSDSLCHFRRQLKTFLFVKEYAAAASDSCFLGARYKHSYLLTYKAGSFAMPGRYPADVPGAITKKRWQSPKREALTSNDAVFIALRK